MTEDNLWLGLGKGGHMKRIAVAVLLFVIFWQAPCAFAAQRGKPAGSEKGEPSSPAKVEPSGTKLKFEVFSDYVVSNKFEPNAAESFVFIDNQKEFDKVFEAEKTSGKKPHQLPKDAFKSDVILAVIKRGKASWEFKVDGVTEANGIVELHYTTASKKSNSAIACPLIVSIPKGRSGAVHFVEDKRLVKSIAIEKK